MKLNSNRKNNNAYALIISINVWKYISENIGVMLEDMPIRQLVMMSNEVMTPAVMGWLVDIMNGHYIRGAKKMKK